MRRSGTDPDAFLSSIFQLRDDLSNLGGVVSNLRLTPIILDASHAEKHNDENIND